MICDYCKKDCTAGDPVWLAPDLCAECGRRQIDELRERVGAALRNVRAYRDGLVEAHDVIRRVENVLTVPHVHPSHLKGFEE